MKAIAQVVQGLPGFEDPNLLVGAEHFSDAGIYRLADGLAIVQSVDFFPPLVDDPFVFGQIAAANALSDIYACGGTPRTALNIVGFPKNVPMTVLQEILRGGADRVREAGAVVVGGHSVQDDEIMYGLCVTGVVDPEAMMSNRAAAPGDALVLTKALGTGYVTTAHRARRCPPPVLDGACASMIHLNRDAAGHAVALGARASTDVTGFGLAGHAFEMAEASGVTVRLQRGTLPLLPGAEPLITRSNRTRANATNREFVDASLRLEGDASGPRHEVLFDPQTSGGLLVAVAAGRAEDLVRRCRADGLEATTIVGRVTSREDAALVVEA
jgi:selenide,water dikinase